jgi:hypothetical protein
MLPQRDLEELAAAFVRDRDGRLSAPRAAEARAGLARAGRTLALAADTVADLDRHACAVAGVDLAAVHRLHETMESFAASFGAGAANIADLGANGRRRLLDYTGPSAKFNLVRTIADRLDELGVPLGRQDAGALYGHAHEALHHAGEVDLPRKLSKVVADVLSARKNWLAEGGVLVFMTAAE